MSGSERPSAPTAVYLAGPIDDSRAEYKRWGLAEWMLEFVHPNDRTIWPRDFVEISDDAHLLRRFYNRFSLRGESFLYTGPFVSAKASERNHRGECLPHGMGEAEYTDADDTARQAVVARDLQGIKDADVVFGWLPYSECHGTLVELGFAAALGKKLIIGSPQLVGNEHELWFALHLPQAYICVCDSPAALFSQYDSTGKRYELREAAKAKAKAKTMAKP